MELLGLVVGGSQMQQLVVTVVGVGVVDGSIATYLYRIWLLCLPHC